jgi:hypothetical protein
MSDSRFVGRSATFALGNGHVVKFVYKEGQLNEKIFPAMKDALENGGFKPQFPMGNCGESWMWDLLTLVSVGGSVSFTGPMYPNPRSYKMDTMKDVFMKPERALVKELMTIVFGMDDHASFGRTSISFDEVYARFKFDTDTASRSALLMFRAENQSEDLYRVKIEGAPDDLSTHIFSFEPSTTWLCSRYPQKSRPTASIGGALADGAGAGEGVGEGGLVTVPAASEIIKVLVRIRKSKISEPVSASQNK